MNNETVVELLRKRIEKESQAVVAKEINVSPQFLYDVLRGNRQPSDKILTYLGLKREIVKIK